MSRTLCLAIVMLFGAVCLAAPTTQEVSVDLQKGAPHPRLLCTKSDLERVKEATAEDAELAAVWNLVRASADAMLKDKPSERVQIGRRLLSVSRQVLRREMHLALAYRVTGERKYAERAIAEMLAAASFTDWNPSHYLDVGEMTAALAIGYDWLYDQMTPEQRKQILSAIRQKGLGRYFENHGWVKGTNNWNQVCNGGSVLGALVIADEDPELAARIIARAVDGLPRAMQEYEPDGAYPEGASYWEYGTTYNVVMLAALKSALGTDYGLSTKPGFLKTPEYFLHVTGSSGLFFNYADCGQRGAFSPAEAMYYFASLKGDPSLLYFERQVLRRLVANPAIINPARTGRFLPMLLVWGAGSRDVAAPNATSYVGQGMTPVALIRSSWAPDATFFGIKGGQASAPHGHMDAGTFVVDIGGVRFAEDLGMQDYNSLEQLKMNLWDAKSGSDRWRVFRLNAWSHNVMVVDGKEHPVGARAGFIETNQTSAKLDLSKIYAGQLTSATRAMSLTDKGVQLVDEITGGEQPATIRWAFLTKAEVSATGNKAVLINGGKKVTFAIDGLADVDLQGFKSDPPPAKHDVANPGTRMLGFTFTVQPKQKVTLTATWEK